MDQELVQLKKQVRLMKGYLFVSTSAFLFLFFCSFKGGIDRFGIIRAQGIIIEDSAGKDRILIGAPLPFSKDRVRTDTALVRKYWSKKYPNADQFMKWYKNYQHSGIGIAILNEQGFDKVVIGEKLPDPNTGKRMFEPTGMFWNDDEGFERGGIGVNKTKDGRYRTAVGLDDKDGEAVHLVALEDGTKGLIIGNEQGRMLLGASPKDGFFGSKEDFMGIQYFNTKGELVKKSQ
jgi:hypothetical protein